MEIGVRELRNQTADVIERVRHGESVTLTVNRTPVADIVPHGHRPRTLPASRILAIRESHGADPGLFATLEDLAGATVDELWPPSD
jgi:prevent-host-death family protein